MMNLEYRKFKDIDLEDPFFDSLKSDYREFPAWFAKKAEDRAYVFEGSKGRIDGFLYLKVEDGPVDDVIPRMPPARRIKVGTLKINPHGTRLGERFVKKIFDHAVFEGVGEIYLTVFEKHAALLALVERYGFRRVATKTTPNGVELVLSRRFDAISSDVVTDYPLVHSVGKRKFILALYPEWHTRLLPDSILRTEDASIVQDVSHTNSIHKVYLTSMRGTDGLRRGDVLVIYRTNPGDGSAHYRSVATSVCVVEEVRNIGSFAAEQDFLEYCRPYSIFRDQELRMFFSARKYPTIIRFTYNLALPKRVTRGTMIESLGFPGADQYWGFFQMTDQQFVDLMRAGKVNESLIVD